MKEVFSKVGYGRKKAELAKLVDKLDALYKKEKYKDSYGLDDYRVCLENVRIALSKSNAMLQRDDSKDLEEINKHIDDIKELIDLIQYYQPQLKLYQALEDYDVDQDLKAAVKEMRDQIEFACFNYHYSRSEAIKLVNELTEIVNTTKAVMDRPKDAERLQKLEDQLTKFVGHSTELTKKSGLRKLVGALVIVAGCVVKAIEKVCGASIPVNLVQIGKDMRSRVNANKGIAKQMQLIQQKAKTAAQKTKPEEIPDSLFVGVFQQIPPRSPRGGGR
jgi:predicted transcriptional regulator/molybdopterin converting factor small subunit